MSEKKLCPGPFWAPFWGSFLVKKRVQKGGKKRVRLGGRFGGIWVLQGDLVRFLSPPQIGLIYLFFNEDLQPELDAYFSWEKLRALQRERRDHGLQRGGWDEAPLDKNAELAELGGLRGRDVEARGAG